VTSTSDASSGPVRARRRAPAREDRQVDADRTRAALLDAALEEFAAKGFAGARVRDIADRAGVSKDLVNYHFGSKEGLYRAVQQAWLDREDGFSKPGLPLDELVARYVRDAVGDPRPMRLFVWRGLAGDTPPEADRSADLSGMRRRQEEGEVDGALDPAAVRLMLLGMVAAPVVFPDMARRLFGADVADPEFLARYEEGVRDVVGRLAPRPSDG
jgi:TetR/AcrR family transcriptional regulator